MKQTKLLYAYFVFTVTHELNDVSVNYNWERGRLFDKQACQVLFDRCEELPLATVEKVTEKSKTKWRPQPLDTVVSLDTYSCD